MPKKIGPRGHSLHGTAEQTETAQRGRRALQQSKKITTGASQGPLQAASQTTEAWTHSRTKAATQHEYKYLRDSKKGVRKKGVQKTVGFANKHLPEAARAAPSPRDPSSNHLNKHRKSPSSP